MKASLVLFFLYDKIVDDLEIYNESLQEINRIKLHLAFIFCVPEYIITYSIYNLIIPQMKKSEGKYIKTFLSSGKKKMECYITGIKHEIRTHQHNTQDGFVFQNCRNVNQIHPLGTVYIHGNHGYVAAGYFWYRFLLNDLVILSN